MYFPLRKEYQKRAEKGIENLKKALEELNPALKALDKVQKAANTAEMKKFVSNKKK
jgi:hypothetical protein